MEKCPIHHLTMEATCSWCGDPICAQCMESCDYKKYCPKCYSKISKDSFAHRFERPTRDKSERISNKDSKMDEEEIKKARAALELKERAKKIMGETK